MAKESQKTVAERMLFDDMEREGFKPVHGHIFHPTRGWKFDLAYPSIRLAVEIDGKGRHQTDKGVWEDNQKINAAIELGWRVLRYTSKNVQTHKRRARIVEQIKRVICGVECPDSAACVLVGE